MIVIVGFHYVQPKGTYPYPGIHPVTPCELKSQLEELGRNFEFISGWDLLSAIREHKTLPENACLITFDDGLRDQYENAVPVLQDLGIPALFCVCSQPVSERKGLTVHKTHWLRATRHPDVFWNLTLAAAEAARVSLDINTVDDEAASNHYRYDDPTTRRIKFLLNFVISYEDNRSIIEEIFRKEASDLEFCELMYMSNEQLTQLSRNYMVGSHCHAHLPLATLPQDRLSTELEKSKVILEDLVGYPVEIVSYPHGGPSAVSWEVANVAQKVGYASGITTERSMNQSLLNPLLLARVATNDAPGGESPKFQVDGTQRTFQSTVSEYRGVYFDELKALGGTAAGG